MISDQDIETLFNEFINSPELASWESDLSGRERDDAQRLFRITVRKAIKLNSSPQHISSPAAE